jgi:hypothetical protein
LRAKPEQTQLEHISDASFLGKLLVLPANVGLDWKVIASYKHSSLFGHIVSDEEKSFIKMTQGVKVIKLFRCVKKAK